MKHPFRGAIFENFIIVDCLKQRFHSVVPANLFFFRDRTGHEVDLIIENSYQLTMVEIKSAETVSPDFFKSLDFFRNAVGKNVKDGYVVFNGNTRIQGEYPAIPWLKFYKSRWMIS